jgi:hypothetical protein
MRTFVLASLLVSILPTAVAATVPSPSNTPSSVSTSGRPVRLSLRNMSGQHRQVRLNVGVVDLPVGLTMNIDSQIGAKLYIVSDTNRSVDEQILVKSGDDAGYIRIQ